MIIISKVAMLIHNLNNSTMCAHGFVELTLEMNNVSERAKVKLNRVLEALKRRLYKPPPL